MSPTLRDWSSPASATGRVLRVVMRTVSGALESVPSLTMSWITYSPGRSARNVGPTAVGIASTAVLPAGRVSIDQAKVSGEPSGSCEPLPSRVTVTPRSIVWSSPASAMGGSFGTLRVSITTSSGWLFTLPSLTISLRRKIPARSGVNVGMTAFELDSVALLPEGRDTKLHE